MAATVTMTPSTTTSTIKPVTAAKKVVNKLAKKPSKKAPKTASKKKSKKLPKKVSENESVIATEWFLYMVEYADGRGYTGITTDVNRRFAEHSEGGIKGAKALRGKGPLKLVFQQQMLNRSTASIAESAIKKLSKKQKLLLIAKGLY